MLFYKNDCTYLNIFFNLIFCVVKIKILNIDLVVSSLGAKPAKIAGQQNTKQSRHGVHFRANRSGTKLINLGSSTATLSICLRRLEEAALLAFMSQADSRSSAPEI